MDRFPSLVSLASIAALGVLAGCLAKTVEPGSDQPATPDPSSTPGPNGAPPETFETAGPIVALATNASHVCWTSLARGPQPVSLVACAAKSDGRVVELVRDGLVHPWIAMSAGEVFWSTETTATIERASVSGGAPVPFVTSAGPHGRFVLAKETAYWLVDAGAGSTRLLSAWAGRGANDGAEHVGKAALIADLGAADPELLAVDAYNVYDHPVAYTFGGGGVVRARLGDVSPERARISQGCATAADLVADASRMLLSCQDGTLHSVPTRVDEGATGRVIAGVGGGRIAARGDGNAYVTDHAGGKVRRVDLETGAVEVIASGLKGPVAIAVDDAWVYVGDGSVVRRLAR